MIKERKTLRRRATSIYLVIFLCALLPASARGAAVVQSLDWRELGDGLTLTIRTSEEVRQLRAYDDLLEHQYYYIDLYGVSGPTEPQTWDFSRAGLRHVKLLYYPAQQVLRLVFYCDQALHTRISLSGAGRSYVVSIRPLKLAALGSSNPSAGPQVRKLVFIDPGHGGQSLGSGTPQAIFGRAYWEKDLVMEIARRMRPLFALAPSLEVRFSREQDVYVDLDERSRMAERLGADLFLSLHLNASDNSSGTAHGFEVYYPRARGRSRQGSVELSRVIGEVFERDGPFKFDVRGIKAANFRVLVQSDMPAALVESGFLDHPRDAALLIQPHVQNQIAALLFNAINLYFARTDPGFQGYLAPLD